MEILVLGLNHKTAPVEIREKLSIPANRAPELLKDLQERKIFDERLLLSTCNRTEIYGVASRPAEAIERTKQFLSEYSSLRLSEFEDKLYVLRQPDSVEHLFAVASGLDSMVVGETEINGQVKEAYEAAHENRQTGKVLNHLFQKSFKVAKNLRTHTDIGSGRVSVASVAVDLAGKIFANLKNARVFVIGTGEMSAQIAKAMVSRGAYPLIVSTKHYGRAVTLAEQLGGEAVRYEEYEGRIKEADILIAATEAPRALIHPLQARGWMKTRHEKPLFIIDVAVPRNIDPGTGDLDNVYLYNIDDLQDIAQKNLALRESQLEECQGLVKSHAGRYMDWLFKEFGNRAALEA